MTNRETLRAIGEMISPQDLEKNQHLMDLSARILDKELPLSEGELELDQDWWNENYGSD